MTMTTTAILRWREARNNLGGRTKRRASSNALCDADSIQRLKNLFVRFSHSYVPSFLGRSVLFFPPRLPPALFCCRDRSCKAREQSDKKSEKQIERESGGRMVGDKKKERKTLYGDQRERGGERERKLKIYVILVHSFSLFYLFLFLSFYFPSSFFRRPSHSRFSEHRHRCYNLRSANVGHWVCRSIRRSYFQRCARTKA